MASYVQDPRQGFAFAPHFNVLNSDLKNILSLYAKVKV